MRQLVVLLFSLTWLSCCMACGARPEAPSSTIAAVLESETVGMVSDDDKRPFCAGVWISQYEFVTAGHCVEDIGAPKTAAESEAPWDPIGQETKYTLHGDLARPHYYGKVAGFNKDLDLGLVLADKPYPEHAFARVSEAEIHDGDEVEVVGHPNGYVWSFARGYVSAQREDWPNADETPMHMLQVAVPFGPGNSGGGAFDTAGRLIGVASYYSLRTNGMGMFVHRSAVRAFLRSARAIR